MGKTFKKNNSRSYKYDTGRGKKNKPKSNNKSGNNNHVSYEDNNSPKIDFDGDYNNNIPDNAI